MSRKSRANRKGGAVFYSRKRRRTGWARPAAEMMFTRLEEAIARDDEDVDWSELEDDDKLEFIPEDFEPEAAEECVLEIDPKGLDRLLDKP